MTQIQITETKRSRPRRRANGGLMPLPSFIRASGHDAAANRMRAACRKKWNRGDWNAMCGELDRLIRACYGRPTDAADSEWPFVRFSIAENLERAGHFHLDSDFDAISAFIDEQIEGTTLRTAKEG